MHPPVRLGVRIAVLLALAVLPALTGALDQPFLLDLALRIMILATAAVSLNLILGYGGMISFGHAAYIGIGAYAVGIPAYYGEYSGYVQLPLAIGAGALFALVTGYICLRTKGVYFIMITLAFAQMAYFAFVSIEEYGGDDGLVIEQRSEFTGIIDMESTHQFYYVVLVFLVGALYLVSRIVNARFGMAVQGAKDNDQRMQSLGFDTFRYRLACYVIAGAMAAAAGWLMGNYNYFFSPEMMGWTHSGELIFMVVLGGAGSLFGPLYGAIVLIILEEQLSSATVYWPLILGAILIAVVLFARGGLEGMLAKLERRK
ncbi:MAG: branched-chain amino acid ABC transporter permease [Alphaproteobacteria bacterium]|nr:branched-chain amino acid ABC transporter permease [Alphaproteobacteria bacterium]MDP6587927.1 branched-chain amino acid ABC transporter permease [Alphaproteobacteria bacterium]